MHGNDKTLIKKFTCQNVTNIVPKKKKKKLDGKIEYSNIHISPPPQEGV